jgi:hypothetical protein
MNPARSRAGKFTMGTEQEEEEGGVTARADRAASL